MAAIGELTDSLLINLDAIPKIRGLDGTELAISESQERMAVVVSRKTLIVFELAAAKLGSCEVVVVTDDGLKMMWRGKTIVDISRDFLATNGIRQHSKVYVSTVSCKNYFKKSSISADLKAWLKTCRI